MSAVPAEIPRRSLIADMAGRYNMEPKAFADTLRATVVPKNASNEEFAAFLMVAKEYSLNPITKEIYAFPKQGGGIQPIVSVDGWANLINSHPQCDGWEFEDHLDGKDLVSVTCRMFRKDRQHSMEATEYMAECKRDTSTWKQWPRRMLRHKALIQAARYAFGFADIVDPDEAERFTSAPNGHYANTPGPRMTPPPAPALAAPVVEMQTAATEPAPISEAEERALDRQTVREANGETERPDEMADWLSDRIAEAKRTKSIAALDEMDDQVCRELADADREDLRAGWNNAYAAQKAALKKA